MKKLLLFLLAFVAQSAFAASVTNGPVNVTVTLTDATHVHYTYFIPKENNPTAAYGAWLYFTTGDGGPYGTQFFDLAPGPSADVSGSGNITITPGQWFRIGARIMTTPTTPDQLLYWQASTPGVGSNKTITLTYQNESATAGIWCAVVRTDQPGMTFQNQFVQPGGMYSASINVLSSDTATYRVVVINADAAFAAGGGSIDYFEGVNGAGNVYDFTGYTTTVGQNFTVAANGVTAGQSSTPGQTVSTPAAGTEEAVSLASLTNPNYRPVGSLTGSDAVAVKNTNAITAAIADMKAALPPAGGGGTATDMTATNAKLDAINANVITGNTKADTANTYGKKVADFADGTHANQTSYDNAAKLTAAQSAAAGVTAFAGKKPTVTGALSASIPGTQTDWGAVVIGAQTFTFGFGRMDSSMDALFVAGRSLLLAAMCIGFCKGASTTVTKYVVALPQVVAQDTGFGPENIAPGVSQAKTYATAAVAVGFIFTGAASVIALVDTLVTYYGGGITTIFAAINFPAASMAGALDRFVPLAAGLGLTVLGVAVPYLVAPLYLATSAILRFLKT